MVTDSEPGQSIIKALEHYESPDADRFYLRVWAGGDINIGIGLYTTALSDQGSLRFYTLRQTGR